MLQWARGHGCPWGASTCFYAAEGGHLSTLQWLREHGCPWEAAWVREAARLQPEVRRWLNEIEQHDNDGEDEEEYDGEDEEEYDSDEWEYDSDEWG